MQISQQTKKAKTLVKDISLLLSAGIQKERNEEGVHNLRCETNERRRTSNLANTGGSRGKTFAKVKKKGTTYVWGRPSQKNCDYETRRLVSQTRKKQGQSSVCIMFSIKDDGGQSRTRRKSYDWGNNVSQRKTFDEESSKKGGGKGRLPKNSLPIDSVVCCDASNRVVQPREGRQREERPGQASSGVSIFVEDLYKWWSPSGGGT